MFPSGLGATAVELEDCGTFELSISGTEELVPVDLVAQILLASPSVEFGALAIEDFEEVSNLVEQAVDELVKLTAE